MFMTRWSRQRAYGVEIRSSGSNVESDSFVCGHCGSDSDPVGPFRDPADIGALCNCCQQLICYRCRGKGCMPLELRLDHWERYNAGLRYLRKDRLFEIFEGAGAPTLGRRRAG